MQNKAQQVDNQKTIESIKKGIDDVQVQINSVIDANIKQQLTGNNGKIKEEIIKINSYYDKIKENSEKLVDSNLTPEQKSEILTNLNNLNTDMGTIIKNSITRMEDIEKYLKNIESKLVDGNSISEIINSYKIYLETLSIHELCILMNLLISIFILTCLISILFAFYGNYLIDKFSLETKLPKLSGIIKIRIKLQHYYIFINSFFIIIALILSVYVNYCTLIYA
jgi:hypothetical protein